jgi:hypothetical protein
MSKSGPLRIEGCHSLTFVALCWAEKVSATFSSLGVNDPPVMERSVPAVGLKNMCGIFNLGAIKRRRPTALLIPGDELNTRVIDKQVSLHSGRGRVACQQSLQYPLSAQRDNTARTIDAGRAGGE